ncbi:histidine kinase [Paenibacillus sp. IB182496]|uniref:Histidine kinase n=1 Tax=Paenibacillus sabuli TaxID=2772509 RepID=A0A927BTR7_9BACL|nr:histidine kinase [Paenibacillus sabuli]MBD2845374.1 histidine kinase [Paenibacillus sabuli]
MKNSKEKLLVCVYYGPNGERLIRRGAELARMMGCPLDVVNVVPGASGELDFEMERFASHWQTCCSELGADYLSEPAGSRDRAEAIAEVARKRGATQIVIGQSGQTRWQEITQGSFINELLGEIGNIDLHVVAVQRMDDKLYDSHEHGVPVFVVHEASNFRIAGAEGAARQIAEGVFFRERNTDFDNGVLRVAAKDGIRYLDVDQGIVDDPPADWAAERT